MGRIYRRPTLKKTNDKKKKDEKARRRNRIMNFRVSPEEESLIRKRIELSGLSMSQFFIQSCLYQKILVKGNIKTFDAIRKEMKEIAFRLREMTGSNEPDHYTTESLRMILEILDGFYGKMD